MKRICIILMTLGILMGYATAATAHAQEAENTQENVIVYTPPEWDVVDCTIDQIHYKIWTEDKYHYATAVWSERKCPILEIPSSVSLYGVQYPVAKFDNTVDYSAPVDPFNVDFVYEEIRLPDSISKVVLRHVMTKKINIPKHAKASLALDIDATVIEIPADHDYYRLKDNFVYDRKDSTKIHYILGASGNVQIPEGVKYVGRLLENSRIKKLSLPSTLEEIGTKFADETTALKTVNLSETKLKKIPRFAFGGTVSLKKVKLPSALLEIDAGAFHSSGLKEVVIPNKVTYIGGSAFRFCKNLKKVTLGKKVKRIENYAFAWTAIQEITIPASVEKMRGVVFCDTKSLRKVTFLHKKKMPKFDSMTFEFAPSGIKFYVKNKKMAKQLKKRLQKSGVKKAKIYVEKKKKPVYKNING